MLEEIIAGLVVAVATGVVGLLVKYYYSKAKRTDDSSKAESIIDSTNLPAHIMKPNYPVSLFKEDIEKNYYSYKVNKITVFLDFTEWNELVTSERIDEVTKFTDENIKYSLPFYTTGKKIKCQPILYPVKPIFEERRAPELTGKIKGYDYLLDIGNQPEGYKFIASNKFQYYKCFPNEKYEWWATSTKYPTDEMNIIIKFPKNKPCLSVKVELRVGQTNPEEIKGESPIISNNGEFLFWKGRKFPANSRVYFNFSW